MAHTDHFAEKSEHYLQFRPTYPEALFEYLVSLVKEPRVAWDVGTGNGQAAFALANYFKKVVATDISQPQLNVAKKKKNIFYDCVPAEATNLPDHCVDLIMIAQAVHWFDLDEFYEEVRRVAREGAIIAAVCYSLAEISPEIDKIVLRLYDDILGSFWPFERRYIDEAYRTLPFPFKKITPPDFFIETKFDLKQLMGYLSTWSSVKEYQKKNKKNPLDLIEADLKKAWGDENKERTVRWPLHLLVGRVE